jgi:hypothetical protein
MGKDTANVALIVSEAFVTASGKNKRCTVFAVYEAPRKRVLTLATTYLRREEVVEDAAEGGRIMGGQRGGGVVE